MENTVLRFHVGRGGRFHNSGNKTFVGYGKDMQEFLSTNDDVFIYEQGNDLGVDSGVYDGNGNMLLDKEDMHSKTGVISFDGEYDTEIFKYFDDCDDEEISLMLKENDEVLFKMIGNHLGWDDKSLKLMIAFERKDDVIDCIEPETYIEENYIIDEVDIDAIFIDGVGYIEA